MPPERAKLNVSVPNVTDPDALPGETMNELGMDGGQEEQLTVKLSALVETPDSRQIKPATTRYSAAEGFFIQ